MRLFVLAGTEDGRTLAKEFQKRGHEVLVSTLTEYGAEIAEGQGLNVRSGALSATEFENTLKEQKAQAIIDATHPFAQNIHSLAKDISQKASIPYFRWERPAEDDIEHPLIRYAEDLEDAAKLASRLGKRIFLSTGSKNLKDWMSFGTLKDCELFVRVLPTAKVLKECEEVGLKPFQIIAAQGPFTQKFNEAIWEQLKIDVVITKESGSVGGTGEKVKACLDLNIPAVVIKRPNDNLEQETLSIEEFVRKVEEKIEK